MEQVTYSVKDVAVMLRRSEASVIAAIRTGDIRGRKVGRLYHIPKPWFDRWYFDGKEVCDDGRTTRNSAEA